MNKIVERLKVYIETHPFDPGDSDCETVLDQLYQAYAEAHESDPPEISNGFKELEKFLCNLPLEDNNSVFNLCCRLCSVYERKAFRDGLQYGACLILELDNPKYARTLVHDVNQGSNGSIYYKFCLVVKLQNRSFY